MGDRLGDYICGNGVKTIYVSKNRKNEREGQQGEEKREKKRKGKFVFFFTKLCFLCCKKMII